MAFIPVSYTHLDVYKRQAFVLQCGDESIQRVFGIFGTVMAEDNAAVAQVGIFGDPFDDIISAVILPVERIHIPLYGGVMIGTGIFYYIIVIVSVRRAEQEHVIAGQLFDLVVYGHEFLRLLLIAELCHIFVVFAVVAVFLRLMLK